MNFDWKANGESTYDYLRVWIAPAYTNINAGTPIATTADPTSTPGFLQIRNNEQTNGLFNLQSDWQSFSKNDIDLSSYAGTTIQVILEWRNDDILSINPPAAIDNFYFGLYSPCQPNTWLGTVDSNWDNAANWCNNILPDMYSDVIISGTTPAIADVAVQLYSITVLNGASATFNNVITVQDNFVIEEGGELIIGNNGMAYNYNPTAVNSGIATVKQQSAKLVRQEYALWSSPVSGMKVYDFSPETLVSRIYTYGVNGLENKNVFVTADANGFSANSEFEVGRGICSERQTTGILEHLVTRRLPLKNSKVYSKVL